MLYTLQGSRMHQINDDEAAISIFSSHSANPSLHLLLLDNLAPSHDSHTAPAVLSSRSRDTHHPDENLANSIAAREVSSVRDRPYLPCRRVVRDSPLTDEWREGRILGGESRICLAVLFLPFV